MFFWGNQGGGSRNQPPNNCGIWVHRGGVVVPACANTGAVNRISDAAFDARWPGGVVTFEEYAIATPNPTFTPLQYGAVGLFQPYIVSGSYPYNMAFAPPPYVEGVIALPWTIDADFFDIRVSNDGARPIGEQRCAIGSPGFSGPQTYIFTEADFVTPKPVVGVSINVGFCNDVGAIRVRAYDPLTNLLGTWFNLTTGGYENFNLNRDSNTPNIAAIIIDGNDTAGFSVSRIRFSNECA